MRLPWLTKRSFEDSSRTSPGIISPAASLMMSPGTKSRSGISLAAPSRTTVAVTWIMAFSFSAAAVRPGFLPEAEAHAQHHHGRHHRAGARVACKKGNCRQSRQQDHQRVADDFQNADGPALLPLLRDLIRTRRARPFFGLRLRQAVQRRSQVPEQFVRRPSGRRRGLQAKHEYSGSSSSLEWARSGEPVARRSLAPAVPALSTKVSAVLSASGVVIVFLVLEISSLVFTMVKLIETAQF